ncbi:helix-turn-helix domain-containing protein [Enterococcus gallinarum]|uniref:helix-turn-helix domain-containing protein n=1 Tax=Enterococcus gallinarum TaxID=1353 RepID=UPI0012E3164C|nr:helix-turn-helix transcriptional regulator [Enterococcus gallinarum]MUN90934.1 helix-turn-helix domain-containing protein [Enterococcus gallinarum]
MFQRICDLREGNDLTQHQIASLLNVSQSTYSRHENGELDIPIQALIKLRFTFIVGLTIRQVNR